MSAATRFTRGLTTAVTSVAAVIGSTVIWADAARAASLSVLPGHDLVTTASGFAPGAVVARRLDNVPLAGTVRADRRGTVHVRLLAPAEVGRHRLLLVGPVASLSGARAGAAISSDVSGADRQAIVVVVPLLAAVDFQVSPVVDTDGAAARPVDGGRAPGTAPDIASTADTGMNSLRAVLAGAGLIFAGGFLTVLGRKRRVSLVAGGSVSSHIA